MMRLTLPPVLKALTIAVALMAAGLFAQSAHAEKYASIVIDADTHEVLHARNADEARYPASLTKVMTLYMLFDALKTGEVTLDERLPRGEPTPFKPQASHRLDHDSSRRNWRAGQQISQ